VSSSTFTVTLWHTATHCHTLQHNVTQSQCVSISTCNLTHIEYIRIECALRHTHPRSWRPPWVRRTHISALCLGPSLGSRGCYVGMFKKSRLVHDKPWVQTRRNFENKWANTFGSPCHEKDTGGWSFLQLGSALPRYLSRERDASNARTH